MKQKLETYKKLFALLHDTCNQLMPMQKEVPEAFQVGWWLLQVMKILQKKIEDLEKECYSIKDNVVPIRKKKDK